MQMVMRALAGAALIMFGTLGMSATSAAANPECQTMEIKSASGAREAIMCKDANGRWYEAGGSATPSTAAVVPGGLPARARMEYQGDYNVAVTEPQKMRRNPSPLDLGKALAGNTKQVRGAMGFKLTRDGSVLKGTITITGGSPPSTAVTGTIQNGNCTLFTNEASYEGRCDANGFTGEITSTGAGRQTLSGRFTTSALKIADVAVEEREQEAAREERKRQWQATVARAENTAIPIAQRLDAILILDSSRWNFNRYVEGSVTGAVRKAGPKPASYTLKGDYQASMGAGWVRAVIVDNKINCLEFHDFAGTCRPLGQPSSSGVMMSMAFSALASGGGGGSSGGGCEYGSECGFDQWQEGRSTSGIK